MSSIPTTPPAQLQPVPASARTAGIPPEQPIRTADEVLADWRELLHADPKALPAYPGPAEYRVYYLAAADQAVRQARLLEEANRLAHVPDAMVQFLVGWVSADLLAHAGRMREAADRQRVDDGGEQR